MHTLPNLSDSIAREVFATLCRSLPAPIPDTPEARASRDDVAMAAVAELHPTNAFEAKLAADIVLAEAHYADSLRQAGEYRGDLAAINRCRALAMGMLRQMRGLLRDYQRMQAERDKALAAMHPAAMERAGWWFYGGFSDFNMLSRHNRIVPGSDRGYGKPAGWRISCYPPSAATSVSIVAAPVRQ
jgi:hypothetical protein